MLSDNVQKALFGIALVCWLFAIIALIVPIAGCSSAGPVIKASTKHVGATLGCLSSCEMHPPNVPCIAACAFVHGGDLLTDLLPTLFAAQKMGASAVEIALPPEASPAFPSLAPDSAP